MENQRWIRGLRVMCDGQEYTVSGVTPNTVRLDRFDAEGQLEERREVLKSAVTICSGQEIELILERNRKAAAALLG